MIKIVEITVDTTSRRSKFFPISRIHLLNFEREIFNPTNVPLYLGMKKDKNVKYCV